MTSSMPDEYAPVESFRMDEVPTTAQQDIDRKRALAPNLLPDNKPCSHQLYPAGAVLQPLNKPYTANLINMNDLSKLWPQRSLQEGFGNININPNKNTMCYLKIVSVLLLVQLVLLILIWSKKC